MEISGFRAAVSVKADAQSAVDFKSTMEGIKQKVEEFSEQWSTANRALGQAVENLPEKAQSLMKLQLNMHRLQLHTDIVSKAGESVTSSMRRIQQMGQ